MKYTNIQIISIYEKLSLTYKSQISFPAKVSYCIVRNLKILGPIYEDIMKARNDLIFNNSIKVEGEDSYKVPPDKQEYLNKELTSLGVAENEINLSMIKFQDIDGINIPVDIMDGLFCMIEDEGK